MPPRLAIVAIVAALLAAGAAGPACAANNAPVDPKFLIPVPTEQRKIGVGEAKAFQEGELELAVDAVERTQVTLRANGMAPLTIGASTETLVDIGKDRICTVVFLGLSGKRAILSARCDAADANLRAALEAQRAAVPVEVVDPAVLVASAPKGSLANPYLGDREAIAEGGHLFLNNSCNGCHGGTGGGGMGPALSNGVWVYGKEDDTLFRLVTLGSDGLHAAGYARKAREKVVGPMPSYEGIITNADELWKILAWVRSVSVSDAPEAK